MVSDVFPPVARPSDRLAALALAVLVLLAVALQPRDAGAQTPSLAWSACGGFECATLAVPLDYDQPSGRSIEIALIRQRARNPAQRIGVLLANPGGPGASGIDFLRAWGPSLPGAIRDRFDLVGFDPRGVGRSTPLNCHDDVQELMALPASPDSEAEWQEVMLETREFAELCALRGAELLPHIGTVDAVRDIDEIRKALGEEQINFFGYSYGTVLGAIYADLFPQRLRALVLDGAVDIATSGEEVVRQQALGFELAFEHYLEYCRKRDCLGDGEPRTIISELLDRAALNPIPAPQADRPAGEGELTYALLGALYSDALWPELTSALSVALSGNGSGAIRLADRITGRRGDGSYDNSTGVNAAVNCLDNAFARDPQRHIAIGEELSARAPFFGEFVGASGLVCAYWQVEPQPLPVPRAAGAPPILVIGTTGDPATPYIWSQAVAEQLESAVLLTYRGEGHTAYRRGDSCVDSFVNAYLLDLELPPPGAACGDPDLADPLAVTISQEPAPQEPPPDSPPPAEPTEPSVLTPEDGDGGTNAMLLAGIVLVVIVVGAGAVRALTARR